MILIAGLGRCGSSLTCQMLAAGGLKVAGAHPDYEPTLLWHQSTEAQRCAILQQHQAAKWIDPHRFPLRATQAGSIVLWLDRDEVQQARSQIKFGGGLVVRENVRQMVKILRRDRRKAMRAVSREGLLDKPLFSSFEAIIRNPDGFARVLGRICEVALPGVPFDPAAASAVVLPRGIECQPDVSIETLLLAQKGLAQ